MLAADVVQDGAGLAMVGAVQRAHYIDGRRVVDDAVLADAAEMMRRGALSSGRQKPGRPSVPWTHRMHGD